MISPVIQQYVRAACVCALACLLLLAAGGRALAQTDDKPTEADWGSMRDVIQLMLDEKQYLISQLNTYINGR